jgi:hypothetical protein
MYIEPITVFAVAFTIGVLVTAVVALFITK